MNEPGSHDDADSASEATEFEGRRPSRLVVVSAVLTIGAVVAGLAVWSRADTSIRVPDLIGRAADPVGDNLTFTADTADLTLDLIEVSDCPVQDANRVVEQSPVPGTRVPSGTAVTVRVCRDPAGQKGGADAGTDDASGSSPSPSPVAIGGLPEAGVVVGSGHRVTFVDLEGAIVAVLRGFEVAGNPGSPGVWLQQGRSVFLLDVDQGALVPVSATDHSNTMYEEGLEPKLASPSGRPAGHWRYAYSSPSGVTLAQWSGECEVPTAYWIDESGMARVVTGERDVADSPESLALGWSPDGRAVVFLPKGYCGRSGSPPGIYLYASPGEGTLIFRTEPASSADMWARLN